MSMSDRFEMLLSDPSIAEPSPAMLEYLDKYGTEQGKFIRVGRLMVVGQVNKNSSAPTRHIELFNVLKHREPDLVKQATADSDEPFLQWNNGGETPLNDAGFFHILPGQLVQVLDNSVEMTAASPMSRELSRVVIEQALPADAHIFVS